MKHTDRVCDMQPGDVAIMNYRDNKLWMIYRVPNSDIVVVINDNYGSFPAVTTYPCHNMGKKFWD